MVIRFSCVNRLLSDLHSVKRLLDKFLGMGLQIGCRGTNREG